MKKSFIVLALGLLCINAKAANLVCTISLPAASPADGSVTLTAPIVNGTADLTYSYSNKADEKNVRNFAIEAQVWNIGKSDVPKSTKGFLQVNQLGKNTDTTNYAINHCDKNDCSMELTVVLDGIGMGAECSIQ